MWVNSCTFGWWHELTYAPFCTTFVTFLRQFGWWSYGKNMFFTRFWLTVMLWYNLGIHFPYKYSFNLHRFSHYLLLTLSSSSFYNNNVFLSLAFHKKRPLWKFQGLYEWSMEMTTHCKEVRFVCVQGWHWRSFRIRQETYLTPVPLSPTIYFSFPFHFSPITLHR